MQERDFVAAANMGANEPPALPGAIDFAQRAAKAALAGGFRTGPNNPVPAAGVRHESFAVLDDGAGEDAGAAGSHAIRIVAWNIRAGGGKRIGAIRAQLEQWRPDVVCLCEFRASVPSVELARGLADWGLAYQETTADCAAPAANALLIASRWPLFRRSLRDAPQEPRRWLAARVAAPESPFTLAHVHIPNMVTGRKPPFLASLLDVTRDWRLGPAVLLGDTNCGWPGIDEERPVFNRATEKWLNALEAHGWKDAFRYLRGSERCYTWYSPNGGNGFRLDQAFVQRRMLPHLRSAAYEWGRCSENGRRDALSDHAALLLDFV